MRQRDRLTIKGITECRISEWFVEPGSKVEQFDRICEVQSDKASVEVPHMSTRVLFLGCGAELLGTDYFAL